MDLMKAVAVAALAAGLTCPLAAWAQAKVVVLGRDRMIDHPAGAHYVVWNGPAFLDVGVPSGGFVRFPVASLKPQWTRLLDPQGQPLPVAARFTGGELAVQWLPYSGPVPPKSKLSDDDYRKALESTSRMRHDSLMNAARGTGSK